MVGRGGHGRGVGGRGCCFRQPEQGLPSSCRAAALCTPLPGAETEPVPEGQGACSSPSAETPAGQVPPNFMPFWLLHETPPPGLYPFDLLGVLLCALGMDGTPTLALLCPGCPFLTLSTQTSRGETPYTSVWD